MLLAALVDEEGGCRVSRTVNQSTATAQGPLAATSQIALFSDQADARKPMTLGPMSDPESPMSLQI
ncbi:MAG: hypothetical protein VXY24_02490, partial [Pseudomonadota bacterium]|nr:hypothetical protein [Pseudomonadota bacterium]